MAFPSVYESLIKEENLNDGGYIQMDWNDTDNTPLEVGTACPIDSDYLLFTKYYPSQQGVNNYRFSVKFMHKLYQLDFLPFYFNTEAVSGVDGSGNVSYEDITLATYPFTGNIATIANALADCLNDHNALGQWTADTSGLSGNVIKSITFDGATIKSAAKSIADAFGVEYFFIWSTKTIKFGSLESSAVSPNYGTVQPDENGVTEGTGSLVSATDGGVQYNTFRILGGTRNMSKKTIKGQNMQVTQRLMLDENDSIMGGGTPRIMKDLVFDGIYPKMELWMYDVHERKLYVTDENGKKIVDSESIDPETGGTVRTYKQYSLWYFKLAYWNGTELVPYPFNTNLLIANQPLSLLFQPNYADNALPQPLVGREFELYYYDSLNPGFEKEDNDVEGGYQPVHGEYRIIYKVEGAMILPSTSAETIRPYGNSMSLANNKVTLINVEIDPIYESAAKVELRAAAIDAIAAYNRDKSSFTYTTYGQGPTLGGVSGSGGIVKSIRHNLITGEVQYTVGDYESSKSLINRLSDKIETVSSNNGTATMNDNNSKGGGISATAIPILSQLLGSGHIVKDSLTILRELILGINGHGVFIDANGDANMTIGSLTVLGTTHLNEIDVNHIRHTGGMMVVTKANLIVDSFEALDGGLWKLYFRRRDGNGQTIHNLFEVGDFALMMTFNEGLSGSINRYFWRQVVGTGIATETIVDETTGETSTVETDLGYIILNYGSYNSDPKEGDVVVQLGNISAADRQGATVLGGSGSNGGFFAIYEGINAIGDSAPNLDNYNSALIYLSPKKNKLTGNFSSVAGGDLQSQISALQASLLSITQQSDRQLVIWYGDDDVPYPTSGHLNEYNSPAKEWHDADVAAGNTDQQTLHLEDVYYLRRNNTTRKGGRAWQWIYDSALTQFLWLEITDVDVIAALEAADDAVETANDAKGKVENLADDGIISAGTEKSELLTQWQDTVAEYVKLIEQAKDYDLDDAQNTVENGVTTYTPYNDYERRYNTLAITLNDGSSDNINNIKSGNAIPAWLATLNVDTELKPESSTDATDTRVKPSEYRAAWKNYFDTRSALHKAIEEAAKAKADEALERLDNIGDDSKLDPSEKLTVRREFVAAWRERDAEGGILDRCKDVNDNWLSMAIQTAYNAYDSAFRAVATYLNGSNGTWYTDPSTGTTSNPSYTALNALDLIPLWLHSARENTTETMTGGNIEVDGSTVALEAGDYWRHLWSAFDAARTAVLTALSEDAKDRADDAQETANEKKRVFQTNANELPPAPYDVGDLWMNAIWYTEQVVDGVTKRTYTWNGDQLICTTARTSNSTRSVNDWANAASGTTARIENLGNAIELEVLNRKVGSSTSLHLDESTGGLYVSKYNSSQDTWSAIGLIELALVKDGSNIYSKLNLTADNAIINANLISVVANTLKARVDKLDFQGGTVKIDASNIAYTVGDTSYTLGDGLIKMLVNTLSGYGGSMEPSGLNGSWADVPPNAHYLYPYLWMRVQKKQNNEVISTAYHLLNEDGGIQARFTATVVDGAATSAVHTSYQSGDAYMQIKGQDDSTWGEWVLISGEEGDIIYSFVRSSQKTTGHASASTQTLQRQLGMVIRRDGYSGEFSFGAYNGNTFEAGLSFKQENGQTKLVLRADNTYINSDFKVDAANNIDFAGKTITLSGTQQLTFSGGVIDFTGTDINMNASQLTFAGQSIDLTAATLSLNASQITFSGQTVDLTASTLSLNASQLTFSGQTIDLTAATLSINASQLTFAGQTIDLTAATLSLNASQITFSGQTIDLTAATLSINASQITFAGQTIALGTSSSKVTINGGDIAVSANKTLKFSSGAIDFTGATISMNASQLTFAGQSIDLTAATLSLNASQITFSGQTVDLTAATLRLNASQLTFAGQSIDLSSATINLNSSNLTLWARYIDFNSETITISAGQSLTFEGGTSSGQTQGTISFTGARILMNAEQINFKSGSFVINNGTKDTFKVTSAGNVTVSGTINADSGYFKGELQGATGTFSGSLTSNDGKVLLTSTGVDGWGLGYVWRGFAVSNNSFQSGDLATIGARINDGGYDYGRIALVKRSTGTSSSNISTSDMIILDASDQSVSCNKIDSVTISNSGDVKLSGILKVIQSSTFTLPANPVNGQMYIVKGMTDDAYVAANGHAIVNGDSNADCVGANGTWNIGGETALLIYSSTLGKWVMVYSA